MLCYSLQRETIRAGGRTHTRIHLRAGVSFSLGYASESQSFTQAHHHGSLYEQGLAFELRQTNWSEPRVPSQSLTTTGFGTYPDHYLRFSLSNHLSGPKHHDDVYPYAFRLPLMLGESIQ